MICCAADGQHIDLSVMQRRREARPRPALGPRSTATSLRAEYAMHEIHGVGVCHGSPLRGSTPCWPFTRGLHPGLRRHSRRCAPRMYRHGAIHLACSNIKFRDCFHRKVINRERF